MYTFHLLGLAHVPTSKEIYSCAYTQKVVNLSKMLTEMGNKVYLYCTEGSDVPDVEMVTVGSEATRKRVYGDYDWHKDFFKHDPKDEVHLEFNLNAIQEINLRKSERDFLLCPMGNYNKPVSDVVQLMTVESGIGYSGVFCDKRVFESYAWMHYIWGILKQDDGAWYDVVIPNAYDLKDFPYMSHPMGAKDEYYLYVGRLISRKGIQIAVEATEAIGATLVIAGQGNLADVDGADYTHYKHIKYVGSINPAQRFDLMSHAKAVFTPTIYIGPFEGVAVEAQLCGTPVITTDWGVFAETVVQGITGWRCHNLAEFIHAALSWNQIEPDHCRHWASSRYGTDTIKLQYQHYFDRLYDLWNDGWYQMPKSSV